MHRRLALSAVAFLPVLGLTTALGTGADARPSAPAPPPALDGVRVLISNDDSMQAAAPNGSDGRGLYELRRALCEAGADVVVVAPWGNQSGAGTGSSSQTSVFAVSHRVDLPAGYAGDCDGAPSQGAVFGVCLSTTACLPDSRSATPSDTVRLAVSGLLAEKVGWTGGPALVVSGVNAGPNVANFVNGSGTVGATIAALDAGIPAVAVSANFAAGSFAVTDETYRATADASAGIIGRLWRKRVLTPVFGININHPDVGELTSDQPVLTSVGTGSVLTIGTRPGPNPDTYVFTGALCGPGVPGCLPETRHDSDTEALIEDGRITVTPIDPNRTYDGYVGRLRAALSARR